MCDSESLGYTEGAQPWTSLNQARALHDIQSLLLLLLLYENILVNGIKAVVAAAEVAAAAAMVAEDGLAAARWSCLPIKVFVLPKHLSFLAKVSKLS